MSAEVDLVVELFKIPAGAPPGAGAGASLSWPSHPPCPIAPCRHRALPLVCRRFEDLVHSPPLLASVELDVGQDSDDRVLPRWRSFFQWLTLRAAGHVQHLELDAEPAGNAPAEDSDEILCMIAAGVTACCTGGGLADLQLYYTGIHVRLGGSVAALRGLTRLSVAVQEEAQLDLAASLHTLRRLQHLELCGSPMQPWHPEVRLPASLTKLQLAGLHGEDQPLPQQVRGGSNLHTWRLAQHLQSCRLAQMP